MKYSKLSTKNIYKKTKANHIRKYKKTRGGSLGEYAKKAVAKAGNVVATAGLSTAQALNRLRRGITKLPVEKTKAFLKQSQHFLKLMSIGMGSIFYLSEEGYEYEKIATLLKSILDIYKNDIKIEITGIDIKLADYLKLNEKRSAIANNPQYQGRCLEWYKLNPTKPINELTKLLLSCYSVNLNYVFEEYAKILALFLPCLDMFINYEELVPELVPELSDVMENGKLMEHYANKIETNFEMEDIEILLSLFIGFMTDDKNNEKSLIFKINNLIELLRFMHFNIKRYANYDNAKKNTNNGLPYGGVFTIYNDNIEQKLIEYNQKVIEKFKSMPDISQSLISLINPYPEKSTYSKIPFGKPSAHKGSKASLKNIPSIILSGLSGLKDIFLKIIPSKLLSAYDLGYISENLLKDTFLWHYFVINEDGNIKEINIQDDIFKLLSSKMDFIRGFVNLGIVDDIFTYIQSKIGTAGNTIIPSIAITSNAVGGGKFASFKETINKIFSAIKNKLVHKTIDTETTTYKHIQRSDPNSIFNNKECTWTSLTSLSGNAHSIYSIVNNSENTPLLSSILATISIKGKDTDDAIEYSQRQILLDFYNQYIYYYIYGKNCTSDIQSKKRGSNSSSMSNMSINSSSNMSNIQSNTNSNNKINSTPRKKTRGKRFLEFMAKQTKKALSPFVTPKSSPTSSRSSSPVSFNSSSIKNTNKNNNTSNTSNTNKNNNTNNISNSTIRTLIGNSTQEKTPESLTGVTSFFAKRLIGKSLKALCTGITTGIINYETFHKIDNLIGKYIILDSFFITDSIKNYVKKLIRCKKIL